MNTWTKILLLSTVAAFGACNCDDSSGGSNNGVSSNNGGNNGTTGPNNGTSGSNNGANNGANNGTIGTNNGSIGTNNGANNVTQQEYCEGEGPPVLRTPDDDRVCTGEVAAVAFRYAICACDSFQGTDDLFTDSFDSAQGPYNPASAGNGGSVGVNGEYTHTNIGDIGGSLWVAGGDLTLTNEYDVAAELKVNGDLTSTSVLNVGLDAYVTGDVNVDTYSVGGTHRQPAGNALMIADGNPSIVREAVTVGNPCDCEPDQLVDIDGFIDVYRQQNDNASIGLDPDALSNVRTDTTLDLSCGRFFLSEVTGTAEITITAQDRTALFVGGDITTTNKLRIELADGAELDLFVAGTFTSTDEVNFGSITNPASVRMYLGGQDAITWTNKFSIGGNIYAPEVDLTLTDEADIYGSVFVNNLTATNKLRVHYDSAVLRAGDTCDATGGGSGGDNNNGTGTNNSTGGNNATNNGTGGGGGGDLTCSDCRDCRNQSCNTGVCGECQSNADCCAPLICRQGECTVIQ